MNPDLKNLPPPPTGQKGITLDEFQHLPPPPQGQKGLLLSDIQPTKPSTLQSFATGVAKGELSTLKGIGTIGQKILDQTAGRVVNFVAGKGFVPTNTDSIYNPATPLGQKAEQVVTPQNTAESFGKGVEQIAEFFIPAAKAAKAEETINLISKGISFPLLAATTRVVGKAAVQGTAAGLVTAAQTGGNVKKTLETAATAGVIRGGMAIIGEGAKALHIPERLYSTVFKNSKSDMLDELRSNGLQKLQQTNPEKFQQFVNNGIIKTGTNGEMILNDTLAEKALDNGLRGSIRNMANTVVEGALDSENTARNIAQSYQGAVNLPESNIKKTLQLIAQEYEGVGLDNEISNRAQSLVDAITLGKGKVSAIDALDIRRLLDRARLARSFDVPTSKLSLSQQNLKSLADAVRQRVNAIPEMGKVMEKYSFYLDAMEALANEAKRRGNNQVFSLIDSLFLSNAFGTIHPAGLTTLAAIRKILQSGWGATTLGQKINSGVISPLMSGGVSVGSSGVQSLQGGQ